MTRMVERIVWSAKVILFFSFVLSMLFVLAYVFSGCAEVLLGI